MRIGVLALQGAFAEHEEMLHVLGAESFQIRQAKDLNQEMDGLILPGGESTVMGKLLRDEGMFEELQNRIRDGLPVFGTCAGLILLAKRIEGEAGSHLATMNITVCRNAYGRQLGSFSAEGLFADVGEIPMTFIRAPYIVSCGEDVEPLAVQDGRIVAAKQKKQLVTAFHPELTKDLSVHRYFLTQFCRT